MHILTIIHEVYDDSEEPAEEWDYELSHEDACEVKPIYTGGPFGDVVDYFCPVGEEIAAVGLDSLTWHGQVFEYSPNVWEQWHALEPGRYEIEYWGETHMGEWEGGLRIVRRLTDDS